VGIKPNPHISVLFDALQIPAGMLEFCWIPPDSTGMELELAWIPVESGGIQAFLQEWH